MTKLALSLIATGVLTLGMADTPAQTNIDITTQIEKIQNAPTQERMELMNQLKERIATMSPSQRRETMQQLHTQMRNHQGGEHAKDREMMQKVDEMLSKMQEHRGEMHSGAENMQEHRGEMGNGHEQMRQRAMQMQQNAHREMERNEHMNQREAGEHAKEHMEQGQMRRHQEETMKNHERDMMQERGRDGAENRTGRR